MTKARPGLNVPIRDRRQRKRILTLRNFGYATLVVVAIFAVITIRSEMRDPQPGDYGAIVNKEIKRDDTIARRADVITPSADVRDETSADPMLVGPAVRAQILAVDPGSLTPQTATDTSSTNFQRPAPILGKDQGRVAIVGGTGGVSIVREGDNRMPKLSGGFGKQ